MMGIGPSEEAVETARVLGADLSRHRSRPMTQALAGQADFLIAMTRNHELALKGCFEQLGCQPRLLSSDGEDIADPIGCDLPVYEECARQIWRHLEKLVEEFVRP